MARHHMIGNVKIMFTAEEEAAKDAEEKEWADGEVARNAIAEIQRLEATITSRRLRDAHADAAGKSWLADVEALIATERGKL